VGAVSTERQVPCPVCRGPSLFSARNPWRPFCSQRCRDVDLGAWASEGYRVATQAPTEEPPDEDAPKH
jgi:endogenous inhibitor of DNA gyrase (YacG/DUF329 family)